MPVKTQLIYTWIIPWLDDFGCYTGDPEDIKTEVFPKNKRITIKDIESALRDEAERGIIIWYTVETGKLVQQYQNFDSFQTFKSDRDRKSDYPVFQADNEGMVPVGNQRIPMDSLKLSKEKLSKVKLIKKEYKEKVFLTDDEYQKLVEKFGQKGADDRIEELSLGISSKGYKYKSHYHAILAWDRRNSGPSQTTKKKTQLFPIKGKFCSKDGCHLPAVHRTGRDYDFWWCLVHIPEKDKIKLREAGYDV